METGIGQLPGMATHMPILQALLNHKPGIHHVLEYGLGQYSTFLWLRHGCRVVGLDDNPEWISKISVAAEEEHIDPKNLVICAIGKPLAEAMLLVEMSRHVTREQIQDAAKAESDVIVGRHFHLIFVDGRLGARSLVTQVAMLLDCAPIIVCHDTEDDCYNWSRLEIPQGWTWLDIRDQPVWTSIVTKDQSTVEMLKRTFLSVHECDPATKEYLRRVK